MKIEKFLEKLRGLSSLLICIGILLAAFLLGYGAIAAAYFGIPWLWKHVLVYVPWKHIVTGACYTLMYILAAACATTIGLLMLEWIFEIACWLGKRRKDR